MKMNCWRTTWAGTLNNVGNAVVTAALGQATGVITVFPELTKHELGWLVTVGWLAKTIGAQLQAAASADQMEVKKQLGLNPDGTRPDEAKTDGTETKL